MHKSVSTCVIATCALVNGFFMPSVQTQTITDGLVELPLGRVVKDFLSYLTVEGGLSDNTIQGYGRDLRDFLVFCKSSKIKELRQIKPALIHNYIASLARHDRAEASVKRSLVAIRMLLRFGKLNGLVEDDFTGILEAIACNLLEKAGSGFA